MCRDMTGYSYPWTKQKQKRKEEYEGGYETGKYVGDKRLAEDFLLQKDKCFIHNSG